MLSEYYLLGLYPLSFYFAQFSTRHKIIRLPIVYKLVDIFGEWLSCVVVDGLATDVCKL